MDKKIGEIVGEWDKAHHITDVILLGADGAVRRIAFNFPEGDSE